MSSDKQKKLLLVDDEVDITTIMRFGMRKFGFEVDAFNDAKLALSQYKPNHYGAIILDIRMPGMTGFELARKIWAKDANAKICFMSAFEIYEGEAKKVFVGFNTHCFIKKPIMPGELTKHVEMHFLETSK